MRLTETVFDYEIHDKHQLILNQSLDITPNTLLTDKFKEAVAEELKKGRIIHAKLVVYCDEHKQIYQANIFPIN